MTIGAVVSAEAIRGYVRTLRQERKISQPKLAQAIKMALRTYKDWELGVTAKIDASYVLRAVRFLNGSFDQLADLEDDATQKDGEALARKWITRAEVVDAFAPTPNETPQDRARINRLIDLLATGMDAQEAARIVKSEG